MAASRPRAVFFENVVHKPCFDFTFRLANSNRHWDRDRLCSSALKAVTLTTVALDQLPGQQQCYGRDQNQDLNDAAKHGSRCLSCDKRHHFDDGESDGNRPQFPAFFRRRP